MGAGERISRRAVVTAGENALAALQEQKKFYETVDALIGAMRDKIETLESLVEDLENGVKEDIDGVKEDLEEGIKEDIDEAKSDLGDDIDDVKDSLHQLDILAARTGDWVGEFRSMTLWQRLRWLADGKVRYGR